MLVGTARLYWRCRAVLEKGAISYLSRSDGIAVGICNKPLNATIAAGNDLAAYRARFGHRMAYKGGVDKRAIAKGGDALAGELERLRPVIDDGGYIPGCDHGVPPDISWPHFIDYARRLARLTGWL